MNRRHFIKTVSIGSTIMGLGGTASGRSQEALESAAQQEGKNTVSMETEGSTYYFDPVGLYVKPGDTVTFKIESGSHSSTAYKKGNGPASVTRIPKGAKAWNSGTLSKKGATFKHTFKTKGTYDYFCIPHKTLGMVARIVCGKPGGPAEGSQPPDGKVPKSQTIVKKGSVPHSDKYSK